MTLRQYTIILGLGTAIIWSAWFLVLTNIDPLTAGALGFVIFYATLLGGLTGLFTTIATIIRAWREPTRDVEEVVVASLRQAGILALLLLCALILARNGLFNWLTVVGLLIAVGLLETIFILRKKPIKHHENS